MGKITKTAPVQTRFRVYPDELVECLGRNPDPRRLAPLGITPRQWQLWIGTQAGTWIPAAQWRLIQFHHRFDLAELLGPDWDGFAIHGTTLEFPGLKRTVPASELRSLWFQIQQVPALNAMVCRLNIEIERLSAALDESEKRSSFYRHQLRLESNMGMMLSRVAL